MPHLPGWNFKGLSELIAPAIDQRPGLFGPILALPEREDGREEIAFRALNLAFQLVTKTTIAPVALGVMQRLLSMPIEDFSLENRHIEANILKDFSWCILNLPRGDFGGPIGRIQELFEREIDHLDGPRAQKAFRALCVLHLHAAGISFLHDDLLSPQIFLGGYRKASLILRCLSLISQPPDPGAPIPTLISFVQANNTLATSVVAAILGYFSECAPHLPRGDYSELVGQVQGFFDGVTGFGQTEDGRPVVRGMMFAVQVRVDRLPFAAG
jgi:hypothetical protein